MKKQDENLQAKFTDILKEDESIIGYFSAYNNESKMDTGNMFDVFVKKDNHVKLIVGFILLLFSQNIYSQNMQEIFEKNKDCVVRINSTYASEEGTGTGFFINEFATVLTCYHVVSDAAKISVLYKNKEYEADILEYYKERDTALLLCKIEERTPYVSVNPGYDHMNKYLPKVLDSVLAVGFPLGLGLSANQGKISSSYIYSDEVPDLIVLQSDVAINPANSGGADIQ
jgi:S1-C subfamily serine protease